MKILKIILCFSIFLYVCYVTHNCIFYTNYDSDTDEIIGYVDKIKIDDNKLSMEIIAKERVIVNYYFENESEIDFHLGDFIKITGKIKKPPINTVFSLFNYRNYLLSKKIYWMFTCENITILKYNDNLFYKVKSKIIDRLDYIDNEYLYSFILGDNSHLDKDTVESLQYSGVSHLFSISGMHVTILSLLILNIFNRFISKKTSLIIVMLILVFYAFLIGLTPSIIRAVLMFIVLTIADFSNLKINKPSLLIFIACILLLYNPFYIYNLGFLLSFIVTFFIISFSSLFKGNYFYKLFMLTLVAFLSGIPILIYNFHEINFFSLIANMIMVPFVSICVFPFALITFVFPSMNNLLICFVQILEYILMIFEKITLLNFTFRHVHFLVIIIYYLIIYGALFYFHKKNYALLILLFFILFVHNNINYFNKYASMIMIDVDQGDSVLLVLPFNKGNILIDTGGKEDFGGTGFSYNYALKRIIPYLKSQGIKSLDYLILTHGDYDHMGNAISLVNNFEVKKVIMNSYENNELEGNVIELLQEKDISYLNIDKYEIRIDEYSLYFLNGRYNTENKDSLIIYTNINKFNILLMGDAEAINEKNILSEYNLPIMDIIKIGHHGSKTSTSDLFLKSLKPKTVLISVGKNNWYGHPNDEVIKKLESSKIYRTDLDGSIRIDFKEELLFSFAGR